jgi:hypothetical protein
LDPRSTPSQKARRRNSPPRRSEWGRDRLNEIGPRRPDLPKASRKRRRGGDQKPESPSVRGTKAPAPTHVHGPSKSSLAREPSISATRGAPSNIRQSETSPPCSCHGFGILGSLLKRPPENFCHGWPKPPSTTQDPDPRLLFSCHHTPNPRKGEAQVDPSRGLPWCALTGTKAQAKPFLTTVLFFPGTVPGSHSGSLDMREPSHKPRFSVWPATLPQPTREGRPKEVPTPALDWLSGALSGTLSPWTPRLSPTPPRLAHMQAGWGGRDYYPRNTGYYCTTVAFGRDNWKQGHQSTPTVPDSI